MRHSLSGSAYFTLFGNCETARVTWESIRFKGSGLRSDLRITAILWLDLLDVEYLACIAARK